MEPIINKRRISIASSAIALFEQTHPGGRAIRQSKARPQGTDRHGRCHLEVDRTVFHPTACRPASLIVAAAMALGLVACRRHLLADAYPPAWLRGPPPEPAIPFLPAAGEPAVQHPCGPAGEKPCIFLSHDFYNFAWGPVHTAWFMDTEGREFTFADHRRDGRDIVHNAEEDQQITPAEFQVILRAASPQELRVTTGDLSHALSLLSRAVGGPTETIRSQACNDGGGSTLSGYLFDPATRVSRSVFLQDVECDAILKDNASPPALELAQWVNVLLGHARPRRR